MGLGAVLRRLTPCASAAREACRLEAVVGRPALLKWISLFGQENGLVLVVLLSQGREYQNLVL